MRRRKKLTCKDVEIREKKYKRSLINVASRQIHCHLPMCWGCSNLAEIPPPHKRHQSPCSPDASSCMIAFILRYPMPFEICRRSYTDFRHIPSGARSKNVPQLPIHPLTGMGLLNTSMARTGTRSSRMAFIRSLET